MAAADRTRASPSGIANQGINESRGCFLQLLAAVSSALHHGKSSRECDDNTSKSICIDRPPPVGRRADGLAAELLKPPEHTLHPLPHASPLNTRIQPAA